MVCPESPWGPFTTGELRLVGRAGFRPRAFTFKTFVDNPKAASELARRWGFPVAPGKTQIHPRHERSWWRSTTTRAGACWKRR